MFELAWPWLLLILPLPIVLRWLLPPARQQSTDLHVPFYDELIAVQQAQQPRLKLWQPRVMLYALLWCLLVLASARPQSIDAAQQQPSSGRDVLIALDVSNSMLYSDMHLDNRSLSRMEFVKHWLEQLIEQRRGDRLGLILFGTQAYLQAPLTYDLHSIKTWVQEAQPGIAGDTTSIGDAIGLAIKRLRQRPAQHRVVLLITDGANTDGVMSPLAAAQLAAREQIKIYTIGVGAQQPAQVQALIDTASLELDEPLLKDIAQRTGGEYFHLTDSQAISRMYNTLNQLEPSADYRAAKRTAHELYHWPLATALLLSILLVLQGLYRNRSSTQRVAEPD